LQYNNLYYNLFYNFSVFVVSDEEQGVVLQLEAEVGDRRNEHDGVRH